MFPGKEMERAQDWLRQAERDLAAAENSAASGFHEWAAFGAQQCGEKALKALAQSLHGAVRGHSLTAILRAILGEGAPPEEILEAARELDQVYVTSRYPNGFASGSPLDYFSDKTTERLLRHARTILQFSRGRIS